MAGVFIFKASAYLHLSTLILHRMVRLLLILSLACTIVSCSVTNKNYHPDKKYAREALVEDYNLLQQILEKKHPSLYWYTPKDSMNFYFDSLRNVIADSMTEQRFAWEVLAPLTQKVRCGHTSLSMSKNWSKFLRGKTIPSFPLYLKVWKDSMMVYGNLNRTDSLFKYGTLITSINGLPNKIIIQKIFQYLPLDGYADNVNYIRLSGNFPYFHRNVFGLYKNYRVGYIDSTGLEKTTLVPMWNPQPDTSKIKKEKREKIPRKTFRKNRLENERSLAIDSNNIATMNLTTFSNGEGRHLRKFFRQSFKTLREREVKNLVIDLRSNGGGEINLSVMLTKYLRNTPFKVADSAYAIARSFAPFTGSIKHGFFSNIALPFISRKKADGLYHFGYWERHWYKPKKKNFYNGNAYLLINGPTFSAATLFCNAVKGQSNITIVGEEAGGGWHGNNGIMIPDITLPVTGLRVRLPFFKLVQFNHVPKNGLGLVPDVAVPPTIENLRQRVDKKMLVVKELIRSREGK